MAAGHEILISCVEAGGTITGEHGVGMEKMSVMPLIFSAADLDVMARVRSAVDPSGRFNPGKILPSGAPLHGAPPRKVMQPLVAEGMWV